MFHILVNKKKQYKKYKFSFTIIETIIVLLLISIVFLGILGQINQSFKTNIKLKNKIIGSYLAEQLKEWLIGERETDWDIINAHKNMTYCFNNTNLVWPATSSSCQNDFSLLNQYNRELKLTLTANNQINYRITVSWRENNYIDFVEINGAFTKWDL